MRKIFYAIPLITIISLTSCDKKEDSLPPSDDIIQSVNTKGIYVVNEGAFGQGNGELSFINPNDNQVTNNLFSTINNFAAGDVAQSFSIHQDKGYLILNVSQKIEVLKIPGANSLATISGFSGPRYMVANGNTGYVSDWTSNTIKVIDLNQNAIITSIPVGKGPEQMLIIGNKLFVTNCGAYETDSTISIIDLDTKTVINTITVGVNPNSIKKDDHGRIWILCGGTTGPDYIGGTTDDIGGSLWRIDATTLTIELVLPMMQFDHPLKLQTNSSGSKLYYLNGIDGYYGSIFVMDADDNSLPSNAFNTGSFYGIGVNPRTNDIWGAVTPSFTQSGYVVNYDLNGVRKDSMAVGIGPNGFAFD
ncbi:MAG: YncE family protein [Bacteroidota bacterium]|jgi:YVTN family beta-propeller protein